MDPVSAVLVLLLRFELQELTGTVAGSNNSLTGFPHEAISVPRGMRKYRQSVEGTGVVCLCMLVYIVPLAATNKRAGSKTV